MVFVIAFIGAVVAAVIAAGKNRNPIGWGALGFFLPVIGVLVVLCLPAESDPLQP